MKVSEEGRELLRLALSEHVTARKCSLFLRAFPTGTAKDIEATTTELIENLFVPVLERIEEGCTTSTKP